MNTIRVAKERTTIQVDTETLRTFRDACDAMPQSPKMSRVAIGLCRWFSRRTELVKSAVISGIDEGMERIYAQAMRETADELDRKAEAREKAGADPRFDRFTISQPPPGHDEPSTQPAGNPPKSSRVSAAASRAKAK